MSKPAPIRLCQCCAIALRRSVMARLSALMLMLLAISWAPAWGQADSRNTYPGRRVGGGTRGVCTGRFVAHFTPVSNIQRVSTNRPVRVAVLQGPTSQPYPLTVNLQGHPNLEFPASSAGVVVLSLPPLTRETRWETSYACPGGAETHDDPLAFISVAAPPAVSLLVPTSDAEDQLPALSIACGSRVKLSVVEEWLGVESLPGQWPQQLPVTCESKLSS